MPANPGDLQNDFTVNAPEHAMNQTQRGISLIELLIALAIAAVLLGLSLPSFASFTARSNVVASHHLLMASFAAAREAAIVERSATVLCPGDAATGCRSDGIWDSGWVLFVDRNADGKLGGADTLIRAESAPGNDLAIRSSKHRSRVTFQRNGMAQGSNLTVKVCDAAGVALGGLVTSNTGRTRASTDKEVAAMAACF